MAGIPAAILNHVDKVFSLGMEKREQKGTWVPEDFMESLF